MKFNKANDNPAYANEGIAKNRLLLFVALNLVAFQVLISFPIAIWLHNQFDFNATVSDSLGIFGLSFFVASALALLITMSSPAKIRNHLLPLFVLLSILVYFQQYVFTWNYGLLDGQPIDFATNKYLGVIDSGFWVFGVVLYFTLRKKIIQHAKNILTITTVITAVAIITTVLSSDSLEKESKASLSDISKFTYSENKNIFLFLLDGFQSDLFWEMIDRNPELRQELTGFTYYSNTSAVFAKTFPTIPLLLTGKLYQKQQPFQSFLDDVYQESILTTLVSSGWDVGLYPYVKGTVTLDESIMSNYLSNTKYSEKLDDYLQALDLSLFRSAPHFLKGFIYNNGDFIIKSNISEALHEYDHLFSDKISNVPTNSKPHQGLNFQENLRKIGKAESGKPTFRFYHLFMPHEPFLLSQDLEFGRLKNDFASYQEYANASLKLMISYLKELKSLGAYDNASIIITADHGGGEYTSKTYITEIGGYGPKLKNGKPMSSGRPLLLIKNFHDKQPFRISPKPVSLIDIAPTIAKFAGIDRGSISGIPIDEIATNEQRNRAYFHYVFSGWDSKYLNDFDVFNISGDVYDEDSWTKTGVLSAQPDISNKNTYKPGSIISFGTDIKTDTDYQNAFLVGADYESHPSYITSVDGQIQLSFDFDSPLIADQTYLLIIDLATHDKALNVVVDINGKTVRSFKNQNIHKEYIFLDPEILKSKGKNHLRIHVPDYAKDNGQLKLSKLVIQLADLTELNDESTISFSDNLDNFYIDGVWGAEPWGRWTSKTESSLYFRVSEKFCQDKYLILEINAFFTGVDPESLKTTLNGDDLTLVGSKKINGKSNFYFDCSRFGGALASVSTLTISTDKVVVPLIIGKSNDPRPLGVGIIGLRFMDQSAVNISQDK